MMLGTLQPEPKEGMFAEERLTALGLDFPATCKFHRRRDPLLVMLKSLKESLGDLDRVTAWLVVSGLVTVPGYPQTTLVLDPCSDLILELYGAEAGSHARTAIGVSASR